MDPQDPPEIHRPQAQTSPPPPCAACNATATPALTARKIAAEAGMSLGHITYHLRLHGRPLGRRLRPRLRPTARGRASQHLTDKATPLDRLDAFLLAGFTPEFLTPAHLRMRIDLWSAALTHPAIADTERALYDRYRDRAEHPARRPRHPGNPAENLPQVSDLIMATLDGIWLDWMRRRDATSVQNALLACLTYAQTRLT